MNPLTLLIAASPIIALVLLFLCWDQPIFQHRAFRFGLGGIFALLTLFCLFGVLASFELNDDTGLPWRLRYLTLASFSSLTALYFFFKRPFRGGALQAPSPKC